MAPVTGGVRERVAHFGEPRTLIGVLSSPPEARPDRPAVVLLNAGVIHRVGPNRLYVGIARRLAAAGHTCLRFDLSGIGDSERRSTSSGLEGGDMRDVDEAPAWLRRRAGATEFVLIGLCSGASNALRFARGSPDVVGLVLIDPPSFKTPGHYLRHYGRRLLRWESWRNTLTGRNRRPRRREAARRVDRVAGSGGGLPRAAGPPGPAASPGISRRGMAAALDALTRRGVHILHVFTSGNPSYNYPEQFRALFPRLAARSQIEVEFFAESGHTFERRAQRAALGDSILAWIDSADFVAGLSGREAANGKTSDERVEHPSGRSTGSRVA